MSWMALLLVCAGGQPALAPSLAQPAAETSTLAPQVPGGDHSTLEAVTEDQAHAVDRGLAWLAERQEPDGSWIADVGFKLNEDYSVTGRGKAHLGVTALSGMAFLAGGHLPGRGRYGAVVEKALDYVLACVSEDGYIFSNGSRMYDHAFATLFLAEICGMTHREDVQRSLQKAVDFIVRSQNKEGGWRYEPYARESDMSIVVCQVVALRAARNIGIRVPKTTVDLAARYVVDSAVTQEYQGRSYYGNEPGTFCYQRDRSSRTSFALTSAGVTALNGLGVYSDDLIKKGLNYLASEQDRFNSYPSSRAGHYYFWYGHYYGVQAMYTAGSPYWEPYFENLRGVLLRMQRGDGSWPNAVGPGPAFGTAVAVLILEIPYRFLPIFQR
ncbi:MAG: terpene cyclase/mutase family protein [Planctomycetes bacterium]|nr:terpene cyclase/mutase family protein [Planctomycetota bacterium]